MVDFICIGLVELREVSEIYKIKDFLPIVGFELTIFRLEVVSDKYSITWNVCSILLKNSIHKYVL